MEVREASAAYQVAPAYKQTEVGLLPVDWDVVPLRSLSDKLMVGIASAATHAYRDRGVVMFRNQNIKPGYLDDADILYIAEEYEITFKNKRLKAGDLLTARTGYPGTTSIVPAQYEGAQSFTTLITRPRRGSINPEFLCCFINSAAGQRYFEQAQIGGGQKNVNVGSLKELPVCLPPTLDEQKAIATTLSDADALIEALEELLGKKRQIKQGAMQELLTGHRRLPGFSGEWEKKRLGDFVRIQKGQLITSRTLVPGSIPVIAGGKKPAYFHEAANRQGKTITVSASGASAGYVAFHTYPIFASDCSTIGESEAYCIEFLFYALLLRQTEIYAAQTGGAQPHIQPKDLESLLVGFPCDLSEQTAIATVLADMDADIAALEAKLAKARDLKQGMMQALLTGRIRLV